MSEYTIEQLEQKFMNAHNAGDTRAAKLLKNMIVEQESGSAPEQKSWEADDGGLIFDKLDQNEQYVQDLKDDFKDREGVDFEGDVNDLKEENFEYWNSSLLNELSLGDTAFDISQMDDKQKERTSRMFNTYEQTNITGEGSRSGWEQFKDAGALAWAPSTWVGGKFIAGGAMHQAGKAGIKKLLTGLGARSGAVAGGITGAHDVGTQTGVEMQLDEDQEYDPTRTAIATGLGTTLGAVAPAAIKGVGKVISGTGKAVKGTAKTIAHPIKTVKSAYAGGMRAIGAGQAAKEGVAREVQENLVKNLGEEGTAEASESFGNSLGHVIADAKDAFTRRYDELGEINVTKNEVQAIIDTLHSRPGVNRIANLEDTAALMRSGDLTPTQALRKVRSTLGSEFNKAKRGVGTNTSADQVLGGFYKQARGLFNSAAGKAGKGKMASELDKDYAKFLGIKNDKTNINAMDNFSAATRKLKGALNSKDPHKVDEFLDDMYELGRLSGDMNFGDLQKQNLQKALHEMLFSGHNAAPLKSFLGNKSGIKVLQKVFGDIQSEAEWKVYGNILDNAHDAGGAGLFVTRLAAGAGGFAGGGLIGTLGSLGIFQALIKSKAFQRSAMKVFSNNAVAKEKGLGQIGKMLESKGVGPKETKKLLDFMVGAGVWGYTGYKAEDTRDALGDKAVKGLTDLYGDLSHYFK